jgi:hypothetical protein
VRRELHSNAQGRSTSGEGNEMEQQVAQQAGVTMMDVPQNAPSWLAILFMGIIGFFIKRDLNRMDKDVEKLDKGQENLANRINALEVNHVNKGDVSYLADRLTEVTDKMNAQHIEVLKTLAVPIHQRKAPDA